MELGEMIIQKLISSDDLLHTLNNIGIPNSEGQQTWLGGYVYVGNFKDRLRHGGGVFIFPTVKKQTK